MLGAPDINIVGIVSLDELEYGDPVFSTIDEDDIDWRVVDGHPVHTD